MSDTSKLPPRQPGFYVFRGSRRIKDSIYERLHEPVAVKKQNVGGTQGLAVCMLGRATKWPLENFVGEWERIEAGEPL